MKFYVPIVILSINDNIKLLENIKQEFKKTIPGNKYRSGIITQPKNDNLDYMINLIFANIKILFVLLFIYLFFLMSITCHYYKSKILMH